jgi:FeS assembly SUF system regulator
MGLDMLRLTNLADYAVVIMMHTARSVDARLSAATVAAETGLPVPTVAKVTGLLSRAGLLASQRGAAGGFQLARPAHDIHVAEIIEAVDGPIALTQCVEPRSSDCGLEGSCVMREPWQVINRTVRDALVGVRLDALCHAPMRIAAE